MANVLLGDRLSREVVSKCIILRSQHFCTHHHGQSTHAGAEEQRSNKALCPWPFLSMIRNHDDTRFDAEKLPRSTTRTNVLKLFARPAQISSQLCGFSVAVCVRRCPDSLAYLRKAGPRSNQKSVRNTRFVDLRLIEDRRQFPDTFLTGKQIKKIYEVQICRFERT